MDGFVRKGANEYISIRKYKLTSRDAKTRGELTRQINDLFLPQISKAPGFVSYYAVDTGSGTLATVSVFETQSGAEESIRQAADFVNKNLSALVSGPPEITSGEVLASQAVRSGAKSAS
jgi:hypothetical protein